ncbi:MAG: hypothetical protein CYG61_06035 [Actinobacteria bacterium]|nr:MAG: hypothetical protein CYG61_06035 [Actinomycetota bacterium]
MGRSTELDRRLRAEARAQARANLSGAARLRKRLGWPLCIAGAALFVAGAIGAVTGIEVLPFDRHHVISQWGGGALAMVGMIWATR